MFESKTILAIIPARGGSKGVKGKNKRILVDKPLISWSITEALKSQYVDEIVVTTDDQDIIKIASEYNINIIEREKSLALDNTPMIDVLVNVVEKFHAFDYILLLQPTSPLREAEDIDKAIEMVISNNYDSVVSITESSKHPFWMFNLDSNSKLIPFDERVNLYKRRQDLPPIYNLNGSIYISKKDVLLEKKSYFHENAYGLITKPEKSIDIDSELDFSIAESIILKNKK